MRTSLTLVCALSLGLGPTPLLGQATSKSKSRQQTVPADTAELGYESAMKKDLRQLATAEEAYFVDNTAYYSGAVSAARPLYGFSPSRDITISVTAGAGVPTWTAIASHARTQTTCTYKLPEPIECVSPVPADAAIGNAGGATGGASAGLDSANANVIAIGNAQPVGIRPGQSRKWAFEIGSQRTRCLAMGQVETLSGGDRHVNVMIIRESAYKDWSENRPVRTEYESGERRVIGFDVNINDPGQYLLVVSNRSSKAASKVIQLQHVTVTCAE